VKGREWFPKEPQANVIRLLETLTFALRDETPAVQPSGEIEFSFKEVKQSDIPARVLERYGSKQVQACYEENKSTYAPAGPNCPTGMPPRN